MSAPETSHERPSVLDHLRQALEHALDALRCYASMFAAEGEARLTRSMHATVCALALVAFGTVGLVFLAGGAGELLDSLFGPRASGLGRLLVGAAILLAFVILLLAQRSKEKSP